jgi:hypothetical protein
MRSCVSVLSERYKFLSIFRVAVYIVVSSQQDMFGCNFIISITPKFNSVAAVFTFTDMKPFEVVRYHMISADPKQRVLIAQCNPT